MAGGIGLSSSKAESVFARLKARFRKEGGEFQALLENYALERLLYRLSQSPYADRFVLKGAQLFALWSGTAHRHHHHRGRGIADPHAQEPGRQHEPQHDIRSAGAE